MSAHSSQHNDALLLRSEEVIEEARPFLHEDGGDVRLVRFEQETATLVVEFLGNCTTCPLSRFTLRAGLEPLIQLHVPEVHRLEIGTKD